MSAATLNAMLQLLVIYRYGQPNKQVNNKYKAAMNSQSFRFRIINWDPFNKQKECRPRGCEEWCCIHDVFFSMK